MLSKDFLSAFKSVVGSCLSMGILIESKDPKEFLEEVKAGKYKKELHEQRTEVSAQKKKELDKYFTDIKSKQEEAKKKEEEAKAAEEAAKAAAAAATPSATTPGATAATQSAEKTATPAAKPAAKK